MPLVLDFESLKLTLLAEKSNFALFDQQYLTRFLQIKCVVDIAV